jgi:NhaP-type Na+/H+ or K+/H+ antiporter
VKLSRQASLSLPAVWLLVLLGLGAAVPLARPLYAYNRQNPRWEAIDRGPPRPPGKPYRPLHVPAGSLPPRNQRGLFSGKLTPQEHALGGLATILLLTVAAQWIAVRISVSAILLLAGFGCIAGPVTGLLDPDQLFGNLLLPLVSMAVALLLFLESLSARAWLRRANHGSAGGLASVGLAMTWVLGTTAALFLLDFSLPPALLLGLILAIVGSPGTLAHVPRRLVKELDVITGSGQASSDVTVSVLVILLFQMVLAGGVRGFGSPGWVAVRSCVGLGLLFGACGGGILFVMLTRRWIPRSLERAVPLTLALTIFAFSSLIQRDSGFLAVVIMGALASRAMASRTLASRKRAVAPQYAGFLRGRWHDSLLAALFLILFARIGIDDLALIGVGGAVFIAVALSMRPLIVGLSTLRSVFGWRERLLLSLVAPRGVLGAGLAAICGLRLAAGRYPEAAVWVPLVLLIVTGTAAVGALAPLLLRTSQALVPDQGPARELKWRELSDEREGSG